MDCADARKEHFEMSADMFKIPAGGESSILSSPPDGEAPHDIWSQYDTAAAPDVPCPVCEGYRVCAHRNNLSRCRHCLHIFQTDLLVSAVYDADYAHQYDQLPHREMSALRWNFIQRWLGLAPGSRILDIGYGNGALLKHARQHGMNVFGLDVHGEDFGIPTVDYDAPEEFDLICFFDSLEHFPAFERLFGLRTAHVIVSLPDPPDFLLETPDLWRHYKPGEHLHYFSRHSLDALMRRWGLATKIADGFPEDDLRGKLRIASRTYNNIYTAIYGSAPCP
jgi:SAM-dependent methyltransferase